MSNHITVTSVFYTRPGDERFAPVPAHPGEDAGGDIRAYVDSDAYDEKPLLDLLDCCGLRRTLLVPETTTICVDAEWISRNQTAKVAEKVREAGGCVIVPPGQTVLVDTGFKVSLPSRATLASFGLVPFLKIVPRSGLAIRHGITVANSPGIVDAGYRGFVKVGLKNSSKSYHVFTKGAKIAQAIVMLAVDPAGIEVTSDPERLESSSRGEAGFGSTGL